MPSPSLPSARATPPLSYSIFYFPVRAFRRRLSCLSVLFVLYFCCAFRQRSIFFSPTRLALSFADVNAPSSLIIQRIPILFRLHSPLSLRSLFDFQLRAICLRQLSLRSRQFFESGWCRRRTVIQSHVNEDWSQSTTPCATLHEVTPQSGYDSCLLSV